VDYWTAAESVGTVAAASIAAYAAYQSRSSARESRASSSEANAASAKLTAIESQRRHGELTPRLRVICEPFSPGSDIMRMRVMLVGPPGLDRLDKLTLTIRNDHFRRGENHQQVMGGPTPEEVQAHIWGPYQFLAAPDDVRPDSTGRTVEYTTAFPTGEELPFQLEHTHPARWMESTTPAAWLRERGTVLRLAFTAEHYDYGTWHLPCEIDTATLPVTEYLPQHNDGR
jgi:hypothetical protein